MNSSELSPQVAAAIVTTHHIGGVILLLLNLVVCCLIIFAHEARGKVYRKYLLSLQVSSMLLDILCNAYTPIFLVNCRVVFSDSWLARYVDISVFGASGVILFLTVANAYFACVYYRRSVILPPERSVHGWRRFLLFVFLELFGIILTSAAMVVAAQDRSSVTIVPSIVAWVTLKASYMFLRGSIPLIIGGGVAIAFYLVHSAVIIIMILQVIRELNHGTNYASSATKSYQRRAVVSLIFQGVVPSIVYVIPVVIITVLVLETLSMDDEMAAMNQNMSVVSSILMTVVSMHTGAHSLTILACSPSYRKAIQQFIPRMVKLIRVYFSRTSVAQRKSIVMFTHSVNKP